jgi:hypothetical protein
LPHDWRASGYYVSIARSDRRPGFEWCSVVDAGPSSAAIRTAATGCSIGGGRANPAEIERLLRDAATLDGKQVRIGFGKDPGKPATVSRGDNIDPDFVQMAPFEAFRDAERYYASLANECTH